MRKPSAATMIATVALFVALGGAGMAATGGTFILGHSNSATANTSLSAPVAGGKTLQLTNSDTSNPGSTALGLTVGSNHAPFTVNSGVKVANLNADKLDGIDSTGFLTKTGTAADSAKLGGQPANHYLPVTGKAADADTLDGIDSTGFVQGGGKSGGGVVMLAPVTGLHLVVNAPGFGAFLAECSPTGPTARLSFFNSGGTTFDVTTESSVRAGSAQNSYIVASQVINAGTVPITANSYTAELDTAAATLQVSSASSGAPPVLTANTSAIFDSGRCLFRVSYTENG